MLNAQKLRHNMKLGALEGLWFVTHHIIPNSPVFAMKSWGHDAWGGGDVTVLLLWFRKQSDTVLMTKWAATMCCSSLFFCYQHYASHCHLCLPYLILTSLAHWHNSSKKSQLDHLASAHTLSEANMAVHSVQIQGVSPSLCFAYCPPASWLSLIALSLLYTSLEKLQEYHTTYKHNSLITALSLWHCCLLDCLTLAFIGCTGLSGQGVLESEVCHYWHYILSVSLCSCLGICRHVARAARYSATRYMHHHATCILEVSRHLQFLDSAYPTELVYLMGPGCDCIEVSTCLSKPVLHSFGAKWGCRCMGICWPLMNWTLRVALLPQLMPFTHPEITALRCSTISWWRWYSRGWCGTFMVQAWRCVRGGVDLSERLWTCKSWW